MERLTFMVDSAGNPVALLGEDKLPKEIGWQVAFTGDPTVPVTVHFFVKQEINEREDIKAWRERLTAVKLPNSHWCELIPSKAG